MYVHTERTELCKDLKSNLREIRTTRVPATSRTLAGIQAFTRGLLPNTDSYLRVAQETQAFEAMALINHVILKQLGSVPQRESTLGSFFVGLPWRENWLIILHARPGRDAPGYLTRKVNF